MLTFKPDKYDAPFFFESMHQFSKRQLKNIKKYWSSGECIRFGENCDVSLNSTIYCHNTNSILLGPNEDDWKAFIFINLSNSSSNFMVPMLPNMGIELIKQITVSMEQQGYKVLKVINNSDLEIFTLGAGALITKELFAIFYDPSIDLSKFFRIIMESVASECEKSGLTKADYSKKKNHALIFLNLDNTIKDLENWLAICRLYNAHFIMAADSIKTVMDISKYIFWNCNWCVAYSKKVLNDVLIWKDPSTHRIYDASQSYLDRLQKQHEKTCKMIEKIELKEDEIFVWNMGLSTPIIVKKLNCHEF